MSSEDAMSKFEDLQDQSQELFSAADLNEIPEEMNETTESVVGLPAQLKAIRSQGYVFAAYLEQKVDVLTKGWSDVRQQIGQAIEGEVQRLRGEKEQVERLFENARRQGGNPKAVAQLLPQLEREVEDLESKIEEAKERLSEVFSELAEAVAQTVEQIQDIGTYLQDRDEASFKFASGENLFLAAHAEWVETGKGRQDPDGVLYLTDQRLIFEQKEKTGKTLGLFGGKMTQELEWEIPLKQIEKVEAENKGLFGGKDMLHFTLASGARFPKITVEVKGKARCKFWAAQVERIARGETNDERAIPADQETVAAIRDAPSECHVCGAKMPQATAGQKQVECRYCGSVVQL
ncbi:MAG TPA: hypothetical protein VHL11_19240 [Phototrophicaceae bacterium]|jgi:hypothetical protein|nr:hypothetical protein [Phototrophicaceae bacterium]